MKKEVDIPKNQDLAIGVMSLISIEEHLMFTAMKTDKEEYLHILNSIRELRKNLLKKLLVNTEGELWCVSKHLLSATMRLLETGTKHLNNNVKEANEYFKMAFDLYSLFWLLQKIGGKADNEKLRKQTGKMEK